MELEPASLDQIKRGKDGKMIVIENDVGGIVSQIKAINDSLHVRWSDAGEYFVVYHEYPSGKQELLTTALELDGRLVKRIEKVTSGSYDYLAEIDKLEAAREAETDAKLKEQIGEFGERLAHALRKDLGVNSDVARSKKSWGKGLVGH